MKISLTCFVFFLMVTLSNASVFAQEAAQGLQKIADKLALLEAKMDRLTAASEQVIQKQSEITKELDSLRIRIRRSRG